MIFRTAFRTGVTTYAVTLFSGTGPEPAALPPKDCAFLVEERKPNRLVAGNTNIK